MDDFLAVEELLVHRHHEGIGNHIVDETSTHRSREADKALPEPEQDFGAGNAGARAFDTGGEFAITLGGSPQGLEVGASRFCSWSAGPPRVHPDQIDRDGRGDMLQARLREPDIAAFP